MTGGALTARTPLFDLWRRWRQRAFRVAPSDRAPVVLRHSRIYILPTRRGYALIVSSREPPRSGLEQRGLRSEQIRHRRETCLIPVLRDTQTFFGLRDCSGGNRDSFFG